jgi:hypothetical protein
MPAEFKSGSVLNYDSNAMLGNYSETSTGGNFVFEVSRPSVVINPGDSIEVLYKTPSGREVNVAVKLNGRDI